jgi:hypothetical protein
MRRLKRIAFLVAGVVAGWAIAAYLVLPAFWEWYTSEHPWMEKIPGVTCTASGIPGDPLNVSLVGTKHEVMRIMVAAKWHAADPLTLKSCLEIAEAAVLKKPYADAPVSSLYLFRRKEDLAFEQAVGSNPRERHHVRFWLTEESEDGRPVWIGAAVFDKHIGFSETTGQITHITGEDVDTERDYLFRCLKETGDLLAHHIEEGFHKILEGRNGGGDPWRTDGAMHVGVVGKIPADHP